MADGVFIGLYENHLSVCPSIPIAVIAIAVKALWRHGRNKNDSLYETDVGVFFGLKIRK